MIQRKITNELVDRLYATGVSVIDGLHALCLLVRFESHVTASERSVSPHKKQPLTLDRRVSRSAIYHDNVSSSSMLTLGQQDRCARMADGSEAEFAQVAASLAPFQPWCSGWGGRRIAVHTGV